MRAAVIVVAAVALLAQRAAAQQTYSGGVEYDESRSHQIAELDVTRAAISVRHDATDGIGAPQAGLAPEYPESVGVWKKAESEHPDEARTLEPCVQDYFQATEKIKQIAPLTRRPAWDVSAKQINAALEQAEDLVKQGDRCELIAQGPSGGSGPSSGTSGSQQGPYKLRAQQGGPASPGPSGSYPPPTYGYSSGTSSYPPPTLSGGASGGGGSGGSRPPAPRPRKPVTRYATTTLTYTYQGRSAQQTICITRSDNNSVQNAYAEVGLSSAKTTQFQFFTRAAGYVSPSTYRLTGLYDINGQFHSLQYPKTLSFSTKRCRL
jgi:hypothetical protein